MCWNAEKQLQAIDSVSLTLVLMPVGKASGIPVRVILKGTQCVCVVCVVWGHVVVRVCSVCVYSRSHMFTLIEAIPHSLALCTLPGSLQPFVFCKIPHQHYLSRMISADWSKKQFICRRLQVS